jgi:DoxX-like family
MEAKTRDPHPWMYWIATLFVTLTAFSAGVSDVLHLPPFFGVLLRLGYPAYFGTLLGVWKVLGAVALLAPRYALIKEWAYAGMFFDYVAAVVSHGAVGDGAVALIAPLVSIAALVASWYLRPSQRRLSAARR